MKIAVITDSNSGISMNEARELGIYVVPMPFLIDGKEYFEGITLTQEKFYERLEAGSEVSTSQPSPESVMNTWDDALATHDAVIYIPMSSGLSSSCQTALMLAEEDYGGRVFVVNNQRISVTQRQSALDALAMIKKGYSAADIKRILEEDRLNSSIYITVGTLEYLKKGGRITPAVYAIGSLLRIKPILSIQGEKLDAFATCRTISHGKETMIAAIRKDAETRFGGLDKDNVYLAVACSANLEDGEAFAQELREAFPGFDVYMAPLSLSIGCHIGPKSLAVTVTKKLKV
ncbi:MAG: DegV family protein [Lachnospiraceae bacterium]|nr:DegV family protein [Lachnospiraceae bacterium]